MAELVTGVLAATAIHGRGASCILHAALNALLAHVKESSDSNVVKTGNLIWSNRGRTAALEVELLQITLCRKPIAVTIEGWILEIIVCYVHEEEDAY